MSVLFQTINPSIGFIIHILSEGITCYLRLVGIFTERCEVMLLSSTDLKVCLARPWSTIFSIAIRLNCFLKACCWVVRQYYIHLGCFFSCFSRAHRSHNFLFVFVLFSKCCILFLFVFFEHCVCTAVSRHANRSTSVLTCALFYLFFFLSFVTFHIPVCLK